MPRIHPTATVEDGVKLADDVIVGPQCVLEGDVTIGAGTRLHGHVYVTGPTTIGENNTIYPYACLGFAPQSVSYDPDHPGCGLEIGDRNTLRESVTIHRAMTDEGPTRVGNDNLLMVNAHAGHDSQIGDHCVFANGVLIAGHAEIGDRVNMGGNAGVHQFVRVGRGAMLSGLCGVALDVPPYFLVTDINRCRGVNLIGLRRSGVERSCIDDVRWVYRVLCRQGLTLKSALEALRERASSKTIAEYIEFIEGTNRGVCTARGRDRKSMADASLRGG
jgi:UDP-N-acetylglucosamine acyltransferase